MAKEAIICSWKEPSRLVYIETEAEKKEVKSANREVKQEEYLCTRCSAFHVCGGVAI